MVAYKIRVLVVDGHKIMIDGLVALIRKKGDIDIEVVGTASDGKEAIEVARSENPNVVLMDYRMPQMDGARACRQMREENPDLKVLILTGSLDRSVVDGALCAGAKGIISKESVFDEIICAINTVYNGQEYFCETARGYILDNYLSRIKGSDSPDRGLSETDRLIIRHLSDGKSIKQIGQCLNRSSKTIDARRRLIMEKLGITNMAQLTKFAIREGLTSLMNV